MRVRSLILALAIGLGSGLTAPAEEHSADRIGRLITQLGSTKFAEREAATRVLEAIGAPALAALKQCSSSPDLEVKRRAAGLVRKIETRVETERLLTPTNLRLAFENIPLDTALTELASKSGHTIVLRGPKAKFAARRITLDTGETTFWQALDALCHAAGLVELYLPPPVNPAVVAEVEMLQRQQLILRGMAGGGVAPLVVPPGASSLTRRGSPDPGQAYGEAQTFASNAKGGRSPISLIDGKASDGVTHYAGAVRIRAAVAQGKSLTLNEITVTLDVAAEPTLQGVNVRDVRLECAQDGHGQALTQLTRDTGTTMTYNQIVALRADGRMGNAATPALREQVSIHLQPSERPATELRELKGMVVAAVQTLPEAIMTVDDLAHAQGKTVKGTRGGSITVKEVKALADSLRMSIELDVPPEPESDLMVAALNGGMPANVVLIRNRQLIARRNALPGAPGMWLPVDSARPVEGLAFVDGQGGYVPVDANLNRRVVNNTLVQEYTLIWSKRISRNTPVKLVYNAARTHLAEIPFVLHGIKLP